MRADTWGFKVVNVVAAGVTTVVLWWVFKERVPDLAFIVLPLWMLHTRDTRSRLKELNDRLKLNVDVIGALLTEEFYDYEAMLDAHGFDDEADALFGNDDLPRT